MSAPDRPKVIIADDESFMLRLLDATFKRGGYDTALCRDGQEALNAAVKGKPHLIVMDIMMPGLDGLSAIRRLKEDEDTRQIPVIVLSSKGQALTSTEAEDAGAALFLTKPFSPARLLSEANGILGRSQP